MSKINWGDNALAAQVRALRNRPAIGAKEKAGQRCAILGLVIEFYGLELDTSNTAALQIAKKLGLGKISTDAAFEQMHKLGALNVKPQN